MPLYRGFRKGPPSPPPPEEGPTRRIARPGAESSTPGTASPNPPAAPPAREAQPAVNKSTPAPVDTTRRIARADPAVRSRPLPPLPTTPAVSPSVSPAAPETPAALRDPLANPVVGWLAIVAGPGRGAVLPLTYGVNDIGRGAGVRIRLDFGSDPTSASGQPGTIYAAIIYTARSRRFYVQAVGAEAWLNGQPLRESTELNGGETLRLGQTQLRFAPLCGVGFDWRDGS